MAPARSFRPPNLKPLHFPAPVNGLDTVSPASRMPELNCPVLYNMIGSENGLRCRLGYSEWVTGLTGLGTDNTVRSIMPYTGSDKGGAKDRLFCATLAGIYDVTNSSQAPGAKKITFANPQLKDAGYGTWWITTTPADRYLIYCDEENGYFIYTESADTWAPVTQGAGAGQIQGSNPVNYVGGTFFKQRNWFVRRNSTVADYLAAGAVFGPATSFDFGSKFSHGGILVGLYNWAYDGGAGMDNLLVALSSAGDIVIYVGTDPASTNTFQLKGVWFGGGVPYGRRIATDIGGDMLIATSMGVLPLSKLVIGNPVVDRSVYATFRIGNLFTKLVDQRGGMQAWSLRLHPNDAALVLTVPTADGQPTSQLVMSLITRGWSSYRGVPMICGEAWQGKFYFGTHDGRICISKGYVDNVLLSDPTGGTFTNIDYSLITRSDSGILQRTPRQLRPTILSSQVARLNAEARFRYSQLEAAVPAAPAGGNAPAALFDNALFDGSLWGGDFISAQPVFGASGRGPEIAVAIRGSAFSRTVLTGIDVLYEEGGFF